MTPRVFVEVHAPVPGDPQQRSAVGRLEINLNMWTTTLGNRGDFLAAEIDKLIRGTCQQANAAGTPIDVKAEGG